MIADIEDYRELSGILNTNHKNKSNLKNGLRVRSADSNELLNGCNLV